MKEEIKFREFDEPHMTAICDTELDVEEWILYDVDLALRHPLPWFWNTETNEYVDSNGHVVELANMTKLGYNPFTEYERYYVIDSDGHYVECADVANALEHIKTEVANIIKSLNKTDEYHNYEFEIIGTQHGTEFTLRTMKLEFEKFFQDWE